MMPRRAFVLALCLLGCGRRQAPAPAPVHGSDGAIESLRPVFRTENSEYFALTYRSDGLRVEGFLGRPRSGGPHPAVVFNRAGYLNLASLRGPEIVPVVEAGFASVEKARLLASLLSKASKTVKLVTYPGDNHALDAHGNGYPEALDWLAAYIGKPGEDHTFARHRDEISRAFRAWPR